MSLSPGSRLGPFEITAPLGAGGMGEVYRARDPRLDRDVAIKVLPDALARDAGRLARFEREARVLAGLSDSGIAALFGVEDAGGHPALVMVLVEGPTLADRILRGPSPPDEALGVARQLAGALEHAHEHGIVHRDLKPANVKLRPDGAVKVLEFGLARALESETAGGASGEAGSGDVYGDGSSGSSQFSIADDGTPAWLPGGSRIACSGRDSGGGAGGRPVGPGRPPVRTTGAAASAATSPASSRASRRAALRAGGRTGSVSSSARSTCSASCACPSGSPS
jgi:serine/threonine protein kinase